MGVLSCDISTDVQLLFTQVLRQVDTPILPTRIMIAAIKKWMPMISAILRINILTFSQEPSITDHTPDFCRGPNGQRRSRMLHPPPPAGGITGDQADDGGAAGFLLPDDDERGRGY